MTETAVVEQLDRALAAPFPPALDKEAEHGAELLATQWVVATHFREVDDHELRIGGDRKPRLPGNGLWLLADDVRIDPLPTRRNHQALERALLIGGTEERALPTKRVAHRPFDGRVANHRVLGRAQNAGVEGLSVDDIRDGLVDAGGPLDDRRNVTRPHAVRGLPRAVDGADHVRTTGRENDGGALVAHQRVRAVERGHRHRVDEACGGTRPKSS